MANSRFTLQSDGGIIELQSSTDDLILQSNPGLTLVDLAATLSFSGAFTRKTNRTLTGTLSFIGAITRRINKGITGTLSFIGDITRFTKRSLTATLSFIGAHSPVKLAAAGPKRLFMDVETGELYLRLNATTALIIRLY